MRAADLTGKVAVVTGGDSGIGRAIAEEFAQHGADVLVTYLHDRAGAQETVRLIEKAGRRGMASHTDQRDPRAVAKLFEEVEAKLGTPFILVNNAGIGGADAEVAELDIEEWDRVIRTNLYGPFYCCQHFIRARRRAGGKGKIVNITSVHEEIPTPQGAPYGASKGALKNLTRTLSLELAKDRINANAIAPGLIRTPMTARRTENPEKMQEQLPRIPLRRPGEPWEVARLALYLASDDSDYVTGQSFVIDGGLEMNWGQGA
jgi:glucose 1-dehydrogenase